MVLVSHVSNVTGLWGGRFGTGGGQVGVMVFFVLSGYLISGLYLDRSFTAASVQDYLIRRAARVLPMFYFIVTVALALHAVQSRTGLLVSIYPISLDQAFWHYAILSGGVCSGPFRSKSISTGSLLACGGCERGSEMSGSARFVFRRWFSIGPCPFRSPTGRASFPIIWCFFSPACLSSHRFHWGGSRRLP